MNGTEVSRKIAHLLRVQLICVVSRSGIINRADVNYNHDRRKFEIDCMFERDGEEKVGFRQDISERMVSWPLSRKEAEVEVLSSVDVYRVWAGETSAETLIDKLFNDRWTQFENSIRPTLQQISVTVHHYFEHEDNKLYLARMTVGELGVLNKVAESYMITVHDFIPGFGFSTMDIWQKVIDNHNLECALLWQLWKDDLIAVKESPHEIALMVTNRGRDILGLKEQS